MADYVADLAVKLLDMKPDSIPKYKIMNQLIDFAMSNEDMEKAYDEVMNSSQASILVRQQSQVGSWGKRFFSRNKNVKNPALTTETALIRLNAIGFEPAHDVMQNAAIYMEKLIDGRLRWPDRIDSALEHEEALRLVIISRLSEIKPDHPYVIDYSDKLIQILKASFAPGFFDETQMIEASEDILSLRLTSECQICFSLYPLILLRNRIDYELQQRWMEHIFMKRRGIYLINNRSLVHLPLDFPSVESMRYIGAMDLLSWYPAAMGYLDNARDWLWDQVSNNGLWDFGQVGRDGLELPLSNNWRDPVNRQIDSTIRALTILKRIQRTCSLRDSVCHFL